MQISLVPCTRAVVCKGWLTEDSEDADVDFTTGGPDLFRTSWSTGTWIVHTDGVGKYWYRGVLEMLSSSIFKRAYLLILVIVINDPPFLSGVRTAHEKFLVFNRRCRSLRCALPLAPSSVLNNGLRTLDF